MNLHRIIPGNSSFFLACIALVCTVQAKAQTVYNTPFIQTQFFKDSLTVADNVFYFNSLSLTNTSDKILQLDVVFEPPCFTSLVSLKQQAITLQPREKTILPIRLAGNTKTNCELNWQPLRVLITGSNPAIQAAVSFILKPTATKKWKSELLQPVLFIKPTDQWISFFIKVVNTGNTSQNFKFNFISQIPLDTDKKNLSVTLPPGESKVQEIKVRLTPGLTEKIKNEDINIFIEDGEGEKKMLIQKIAQVRNLFIENTDRWKKIPLTIEFNSSNFTGTSPLFFVRAYGNLLLGNKQQLNFIYQSDNYYSGFKTNTGIQTLEYNSPKWNVTAGTLFGFNNFVINGHGINIRHTPKKNRLYEIGYVKSREGNTDQFIARATEPLTKELTYFTDNFINLDNKTEENSFISQHTVQWDIEPDLKIGVRGGIGYQQNNGNSSLNTNSASAGFFLDKTSNKLFSSINYAWHSKKFPGLNKGYTQLLQDTRLLFKKFSIGSFVEMNRHAPALYQDHLLKDYFNYQNTDISGRFSFHSKHFNLSFLPGVFLQKQDSINSFRADMDKLTTQLSFTFAKKWQGSIFNNIGNIRIRDKNMQGIFSMYNIASVQTDKVGFFARLDVGPYYYFEIKEYLATKHDFLRLQISPFYNLNIDKWNLNIRTQLSYFYTRHIKEDLFFIVNNISWQNNKAGLAAGLSTNFQLKRMENTNINFFLRKNLKVPLYPKKGYKNIKLVLYKDADKNNAKDKTDEPLAGMRILLNNGILETNIKGEILLKNVLSGEILIDLSVISGLKGWIPTEGYKQKVQVSGSDIIYIPFNQGKIITGKLILDKDERSDVLMEIANIRITAVSKNNLTYTTLTDVNGEFHLTVPADEYVVSLNQNAIDDSYKAIDAVRNIDLINNDNVNVDFSIRQKRRQINIKKE